MDWNDINQFNTVLGIVNGVWGISNIVLSIKAHLIRKTKESFIKELEEERKQAEREHTRVCSQCKKATQKTISILEKNNDKFMAKI